MSRGSYPPVQGPRSEIVRLLVTPQEKAELTELAARRGRSVAEVIRTHLPLSTNRPPAVRLSNSPLDAIDFVVTPRDG